MLMKSDRSSLLVVDVQSRLTPAMNAPEGVVANIAVLLKAAERLGVPALVSEQYPKGLGHTVAELAALAPQGSVLEKVHFSCMGDAGLAGRLRHIGRPQVVVAGIEAHVCVLQTALDLLDDGRQVFVVADATSSRTSGNHDAALRRMDAAGVGVVTTEMVVFEWLGRAGTTEFKELSALIK